MLERHLASIKYKSGRYKKAADYFISYDRLYDKYDKKVLNMRLSALKTKFDIIKSQKEKKRIERYNKELEEKDDVFMIATEIIKEINSSLRLKDIVTKIHEHLKKAIPLDVFGLAIYDKDRGEIKYQEYVEGDVEHGDDLKPIDINSRKHFTSYVIRSNEDIHMRTIEEKTEYVDEITIELFNRISETVIFKRLVFEGEILGVLTVQSYQRDIYDDRYIKIIDLIVPYLAIAVNNSTKSYELVKEIKERKKAEIKLKETNEILRKVSNTDNLTGLYNRHCLNKIMDKFFSKDNIEDRIINLIMIDIDFFKEFNDTYGHVEGDKVIKKIGFQIKDICCRYNINAFRY